MTVLRVGVDVGGTFTKAVAVSAHPVELRAQAVVPTSHHEPTGVAHGVAEALGELFAELGDERDSVQLVAYSTTQAMNALLEGDVARVGVIGIGAAPELRRARKRTRIGAVKLAPGALAAHRARVPRRDPGPRRARGRRGARAAQGRGLPGRRRQRRVRGRRARAGAGGGRASPRARPARVRGPRADRDLRARDAHGLGRHQRLDPARDRPDRDRRGASARRCRSRRPAAGAARRRRGDEPERVQARPVADDRLGARGRGGGGAARARDRQRDRARVRRDQLQRQHRQGRPDSAAHACA